MGCRHFRYPPLGRGAQALDGAVGGSCQVVQFSCRLWSSFRCRLTLISDRIPDENTILSFRHLLEKHGLGEQIFDTVKALLADRGVTMRQARLWMPP